MNDIDLKNTDLEEIINSNKNNLDKCGPKSTEKESNNKSKFTLFGYPFTQIKWFNVVFLTVMHILAIYGYYHCVITPIKALTVGFHLYNILCLWSGLVFNLIYYRILLRIQIVLLQSFYFFSGI